METTNNTPEKLLKINEALYNLRFNTITHEFVILLNNKPNTSPAMALKYKYSEEVNEYETIWVVVETRNLAEVRTTSKDSSMTAHYEFTTFDGFSTSRYKISRKINPLVNEYMSSVVKLNDSPVNADIHILSKKALADLINLEYPNANKDECDEFVMHASTYEIGIKLFDNPDNQSQFVYFPEVKHSKFKERLELIRSDCIISSARNDKQELYFMPSNYTARVVIPDGLSEHVTYGFNKYKQICKSDYEMICKHEKFVMFNNDDIGILLKPGVYFTQSEESGRGGIVWSWDYTEVRLVRLIMTDDLVTNARLEMNNTGINYGNCNITDLLIGYRNAVIEDDLDIEALVSPSMPGVKDETSMPITEVPPDSTELLKQKLNEVLEIIGDTDWKGSNQLMAASITHFRVQCNRLLEDLNSLKS